MSKKNHITTDHFKVGGSGHSGENILHELDKSQYAQAQKAEETAPIPGQENQTEETPAPRGDKNRAGSATTSSNSSSSDY